MLTGRIIDLRAAVDAVAERLRDELDLETFYRKVEAMAALDGKLTAQSKKNHDTASAEIQEIGQLLLEKGARAERDAKRKTNYEDAMRSRGDSTSSRFEPGYQVPDSLFTVVGPGFENRFGAMTYRDVLCRCVCGREVRVTYQRLANNPPKYSCGCQARVMGRPKAAYVNVRLERPGGHALIVTSEAHREVYEYMCEKCMATGMVPGRKPVDVVMALWREAGGKCG